MSVPPEFLGGYQSRGETVSKAQTVWRAVEDSNPWYGIDVLTPGKHATIFTTSKTKTNYNLCAPVIANQGFES